MTLHCLKTGREWPCATEGQARQMALAMGLKDWTWHDDRRVREMNAELPEATREMLKTKGIL